MISQYKYIEFSDNYCTAPAQTQTLFQLHSHDLATYISDSESSDEELNQHLCTSQEERLYDTIKGSAQATQAALAYTMAQCNPTVERATPKRKSQGQDNTDSRKR